MASSEAEILAEALALLKAKGQDYNSTVDRELYFPFGDASYAHMIQTKALRFTNVVKNELMGQTPKYESKRDSLLDLINYSVMAIIHLDKHKI